MKGFFKPLNPLKYKGDPTGIVYRSSWELKFMNYLDKHPDVITWQSEEFFVPYRSPVDNRIHRYFPDFVVTKREKDGKVRTVMIEVKPEKQTKPPKKPAKITKSYIAEVHTWGINEAKWKSAEQFCLDRGWSFHVFTEKQLGIKW